MSEPPIDQGQSRLDPTQLDADVGMRVVSDLPKRLGRGRIPGASWWIGQSKRTNMNDAFTEVTDDFEREHGGERWIRRIDPKCWISVLYRRTGFGWMEWETAIVFVLEPGSRPKRWKSDDRDVLIIAGDRREELANVPKERLREWYAAHIDGNRNSFDTILHAVKEQQTNQEKGNSNADNQRG